MTNGRPPFRADHVGSLLRPPALRQAFRRACGGRHRRAEFAAIQDTRIRDVVALQEEVGLEVVTDGEFRRGSYWGRFVERIDGFAIRPALLKFRDDHGHEVDFTAPYATAKLARTRPLALDEFVFLRGITRGDAQDHAAVALHTCISTAAPISRPAMPMRTWKASSPTSPPSTGRRSPIWPRPAAATCSSTRWRSRFCAIRPFGESVEAAGDKPDELVDLYIDAINQAVAGCPADVAVGVHMCRGNFKGHYLGARRLRIGRRALLRRDATSTISCSNTIRRAPAISRRCASCRRTRASCSAWSAARLPVLERLDDLKRRTDEATRYIDLDRLAISPQCGFASTVAGNPVSEADERAKLALVVEAARAIWR